MKPAIRPAARLASWAESVDRVRTWLSAAPEAGAVAGRLPAWPSKWEIRRAVEAPGRSRHVGGGASPALAERAPATLELAFCAAGLALLVGVPMGVYTGLYRNSWLSRFFLTFMPF